MNHINKNGIWVIGDVHGEYEKLLNLIEKLPKDAQICFTGDLVDRGESSANVIELMLNSNYHAVLGNHELMMLESTIDSDKDYMWKVNGGEEALSSYEQFGKEVWNSHFEYLKTLPYFKYYEIDGYKPLVVSHSYIHHVWINKYHEYCKYDGEDILWRHMHDKSLFEADKEIENDIYNIFGHTPIKEPIITDRYAMIDTGATYNKSGYGRLSAIHYPSLTVVQSKNINA
ncbi:metallophosphoesterase [Sulfurimonas sp. CS5]|uniref:metallophosphoesterase n=1 Tax=Sulfurimonas sp. CS5 TaxID=3391145 RepID=UPI0039EB017E